jgi:hypothetical protein
MPFFPPAFCYLLYFVFIPFFFKQLDTTIEAEPLLLYDLPSVPSLLIKVAVCTGFPKESKRSARETNTLYFPTLQTLDSPALEKPPPTPFQMVLFFTYGLFVEVLVLNAILFTCLFIFSPKMLTFLFQ